MNFYNKQNQLIYRRNKAFIDNVKTNITLDDIEEAKNILRLEVKCKYNYLKKICEKFNIDNRTRQFQDLFKLQIAKYVITDKYLQFFKYGKAHFCSYKKAKEIAKNDFKLKAFILKISQGRIINNYERNTQGKKLLAMDINPLGFINDLKQGILYNPLILLDQKLDDLKK